MSEGLITRDPNTGVLCLDAEGKLVICCADPPVTCEECIALYDGSTCRVDFYGAGWDWNFSFPWPDADLDGATGQTGPMTLALPEQVSWSTTLGTAIPANVVTGGNATVVAELGVDVYRTRRPLMTTLRLACLSGGTTFRSGGIGAGVNGISWIESPTHTTPDPYPIGDLSDWSDAGLGGIVYDGTIPFACGDPYDFAQASRSHILMFL